MQNATLVNKLAFLLCFFTLVLQQKLNAQLVIGTPNLGFTQACASESFNSYTATFVFSPESAVEASNQFSVEMSDASGDFDNSTVIYTSTSGSITTSPATVTFSIPETSAGENYRIRITSTAPAATSSGSANFAAYYKLQDSPFSINNLVSSGAYCTGGSYLLAIDNPGTGNNDSPLNYPSLTFNWYKETSPTTSVFVAEGSTLSVSEEGTYFVETNYGSCTTNSFSNRVTITEVSTSGDTNAEIASSLGNPYCPEQGLTTLNTIGGNSYQWYKDGILIPDATSQSYQTNTSGVYAVQVDLGDCTASGSIDLVSELFDAELNVDQTNEMESGESLSVIVTTTATSPQFEWILDNEIIPGASNDTYNATVFGDYRVIITETSGCTGSREFSFTITEAFDPFPDVENIPNIISPNGDMINDTWVIPQKYVNGTDTEVIIMTNQGQVVLQTNNYQNNWPDSDLKLSSINQVFYYIITTSDNKTKKGTITVLK
ncbi:MAG: gliding motility-associated C-terminal domain-containing protein [Winogradskyella sp.]|uniref:T9SS type B sorting domain-containing protein n=1 Tax=Winogradskyella sp. TaxID=1883156 RepID=UPI00184D3B77|nr:gliding motility-associated C-terminal domain-containing protein [Winogradskyella sp.]